MAKSKSTLDKLTGLMGDAAHSTVQAARTAVQSMTKAAEKAMPKKAKVKTKNASPKKIATKKKPAKKAAKKKR